MNQRDLIASAIQGKHIPCSKPDTATQIDMRATRNCLWQCYNNL